MDLSFFRLAEHGTTVRTEITAGATTFLTLSYIIFVNPHILGAAGMDPGAVFVATCLASGLACLAMGLYANYPFALAPGMGINAYFTYDVVLGMGIPWQTALGAVFLAGFLFLLLTLSQARQWIIDSIPKSQKMAISAGIGLFLILIALENAGIIAASKDTLVTLGDLGAPGVLLAVAGFLVMVALDGRGVPGSILIAILGVTVAGIVLGVTPTHVGLGSVVSMPPSLAPTALEMDIPGAFHIGLAAVVLAFLFVLMFDATGSLIGLANRAGLLDERGNLPRMRQALVVDSAATLVSSALGTSPTTVYIESATGIKAGGRTGLTAVVVAGLFIAALFLSPLAETIPVYATAPALLFVGCMMAHAFTDMGWDDVSEYVPAVITATAMPLTFSITGGIGFGFIAYTAIKILSGRAQEASPAMTLLAVAFLLKFAFL
ncbi:MAG: NCS2 family permease [Alphaproteobacteria bacterium]|nr:NCS2 family permease [Alphaproteobacteria bacterium]